MFNIVKHATVFLTLLLIVFTNAHGESGDKSSKPYNWSVAGPYGGDVRSLVIDPSDPQRLYLGTNDGQIYRSTDGANNWTRLLSFNHPGYSVDKIIIDDKSPKTLYVPVWFIANDTDGTIFKSTDGGDSWRELEGIRGHSVRALAIAPSNHDILIAAAIDGGYQSNDGGETWKLITPPNHADIKRLHSVAIDPNNPEIIYLGTEHLPWKTDNGGKDWYLVKGHPTDKKQQLIDDSDIFTIVIDREEPTRVYASACSGIYCSLDSAKTWKKYQGIPFTSRRTHVIYPDPTNKNIIYSGTTEGLWKTLDGGLKWKPMTSTRTVVNAIAIHPSDPNKVYIGIKAGGVLVSTNGAESFRAANNGFVNRQIGTLLADRKIKGRIYAGALFNGFEGGLFISNDSGATWQSAARGLESQDIYTLFQSPTNEKVIYAGTNTGLYRSIDHGATWTRLETARAVVFPRPARTPTKGAAKGRSTKTAAAAPAPVAGRGKPLKLKQRITDITPLYGGKGGVLISSWAGLFRIVGDGTILEKLPIGQFDGKVLSVGSHPQQPDTIYAGTNGGIYKTEDGGRNWQLLTGMEEATPVVQSISVNPKDANHVFIGTTNTCYLTRDGGKSWQRRGRGIPYGEALSVRFNSANPEIVVLGDYRRGGVYISTDGAENFQRIDGELPSLRIRSVSFDNFDPTRLYVGSFSGGVYVLDANLLNTESQR